MKMNMERDVEILLSVLNHGIYQLQLSDEFHYLIIHQINDLNDECYMDFFNCNLNRYGVRYIQSNSIGLSKSRNLALKNASKKFAWIMDDDVFILNGAGAIINDTLSKYVGYDLYVVNYTTDSSIKFASLDASINVCTKNKFNSFDISSINMILNLELIKGKVEFCESLGLGTDLPSGEEFVFVSNVLKNGGRIIKSNALVSRHPPITSGMDFYSTHNKIRAKKFMFIMAYGQVIGLFVFLVFILKKMRVLIKNNAVSKSFKVFFERHITEI